MFADYLTDKLEYSLTTTQKADISPNRTWTLDVYGSKDNQYTSVVLTIPVTPLYWAARSVDIISLLITAAYGEDDTLVHQVKVALVSEFDNFFTKLATENLAKDLHVFGIGEHMLFALYIERVEGFFTGSILALNTPNMKDIIEDFGQYVSFFLASKTVTKENKEVTLH